MKRFHDRFRYFYVTSLLGTAKFKDAFPRFFGDDCLPTCPILLINAARPVGLHNTVHMQLEDQFPATVDGCATSGWDTSRRVPCILCLNMLFPSSPPDQHYFYNMAPCQANHHCSAYYLSCTRDHHAAACFQSRRLTYNQEQVSADYWK